MPFGTTTMGLARGTWIKKLCKKLMTRKVFPVPGANASMQPPASSSTRFLERNLKPSS
jgi:hypothetical protein